MGAGVDEHFCRIGVVLGLADEPCTTMDAYEDRCIGARCTVDVQLLRLGRTISLAPRHPKPRAHQLTVAREPRDDLGLQGRVVNLVVGRIKFDLIHVQPYAWTLVVRRWSDATDRCRRLSQRRPCRNDRGGGKERPSCDWFDRGVEVKMHSIPLAWCHASVPAGGIVTTRRNATLSYHSTASRRVREEAAAGGTRPVCSGVPRQVLHSSPTRWLLHHVDRRP